MTEPSGHDAPCALCGERCDALRGNPARWPVRWQGEWWHRSCCPVRCVVGGRCSRSGLRELAKDREAGGEP